MKENVILLGAGGHARVLLDILLNENANILAIIEKPENSPPGEMYGIPLIRANDDISTVNEYRNKFGEIKLVNGIGSVGSTALRRKIYKKFKLEGYCFRSVIHPSAIISPKATLGEGAQIMAGAIIQINVVIRENVIVNTGASVDHDSKIGSHVHIAPGCVLSGGVTVGDGSHIGTGSAVIQGVTIGENALIGAGSVVIREVPEKMTVMGVPAKSFVRRTLL